MFAFYSNRVINTIVLVHERILSHSIPSPPLINSFVDFQNSARPLCARTYQLSEFAIMLFNQVEQRRVERGILYFNQLKG